MAIELNKSLEHRHPFISVKFIRKQLGKEIRHDPMTGIIIIPFVWTDLLAYKDLYSLGLAHETPQVSWFLENVKLYLETPPR